MIVSGTTRLVADRARAWHQGRAWHLNGALILLGTGLLVLSKQLIAEYSAYQIGTSGVSGYSTILYLAAVYLALSHRHLADRFTFPIILTFAVACRLVTLFPDPYLSTDVYRYVWDGLVQHAHISPYRFVPGDPALTFLRGGDNADIFANINRRDYAHTIYPPAAQALFFVITWISPTLLMMKTAMVLFEGLTLATLITILQDLGWSRREARMQSLIFAWCPLLIWEIAGSGHLDAAAMGFIALALLARLRCRPWLTGLFLGLAILTKLYPVVLLPALLMRRPGAPIQDKARVGPMRSVSTLLKTLDYRMPLLVAAVVALGYAAYSSVGRLVFGFLGGYVEEEGVATGTRFYVLEQAQHLPGLHGLRASAFYGFCGLVFAWLTVWAVQTAVAGQAKGTTLASAPTQGRAQQSVADSRFLLPAFGLSIALMLLFSPHYPWYIAWLVPFVTLIPNLPILVYISAFFYLCNTALAEGSGPRQFALNQILYGLLLVAVLVHLLLQRFPHHRAYFPWTGAMRPDATGRET